MFKITGTVKAIMDIQQVSATFQKREFVITDGSGMYPQDILFQLTQNNCALIDGYNVNDQIDVTFNLRGREWVNPQGEKKYFNSLDAWRIERSGGNVAQPMNTAAQQPQVAAAPTPIAPETASFTVEKGDDDLPF
ncbi:MAG TPA: DUF3127 domain-containing protein [Crocinitomicaceae bacterium]|nr:DUF3127 domain-containing protein [Crocinitomicaceae bacterium]